MKYSPPINVVFLVDLVVVLVYCYAKKVWNILINICKVTYDYSHQLRYVSLTN